MRSREQRQRASSGCVSKTRTPSSWNRRNSRRCGGKSGSTSSAGGRRAHQHHRAPPAVLDIVGDDRIAALGRHALQHQPAGAPARRRGPARADRQLDAGLDLLRLAEIMLRAFGEGRAGQLDDALIALGVLALIDGEGDIAGAEQPRHRRADAARRRPVPARASPHRIAHSRAPRRRS